jgi:chromosome segregation ATPase
MESVYKLSKYSQKISEACRAKQLNKVMEYNQHELAHINKLSKYFGNQKGGATVEKVVDAVGELVRDVVADRNRAIDVLQGLVLEKSNVIEQIDNEVEGTAFSVSEAQPAPKPADVLQKVQKLKEERDKLSRDIEILQGEKSAVQGSATRHANILAGIHANLDDKEQELAQARSYASNLQQRLDQVAQEASAKNDQLEEKVQQLGQELSNARAEINSISEARITFRTSAKAKISELEEARTRAQEELQAKNAEIAELIRAVAETKQILEQSKVRSEEVLKSSN